MRPQGYVSLTPSQDDLGWNDMGEEFAPQHQPHLHVAPAAEPVEAPAPEVLRQRDALAESFTPPVVEPARIPEAYEPEAFEPEAPEPQAYAPEPEFTPAPVIAPAPRPAISKGALARVAREAKTAKSKAAFTLRLDNDRHLRLRLASAVTNRSAQHLVTEALDAFLESLTDVDTLANQLAARDGRTAS
jgi:hypothetical protein